MSGKQLCLIPALFRIAQPWRGGEEGPATRGVSPYSWVLPPQRRPCGQPEHLGNSSPFLS